MRISFISCSLLWFVLTLLIFFRITQSNHFPLANFYEALIFLTWCLVTLNFIILLEPTGKTRPVNSIESKKRVSALLPFFEMTSFSEEQSVQKQVSGAILAPCILFILAFAQFHLSSDITPLVPALKSNWLLMHVSIMICSYTTFIIGGLLSVILLIQTIFSTSISSFFRKSDNKLWSKDKILSMDYPWFQKKVGWPSSSQLSYVNNEVESKETFLKMQNQMYLSEKSERVFQPFLFNAFNRKRVGVLEDTLKYEGVKSHDFSKPIEDLKSNKTTNRLWQQNIESNWGFPSFESVLEGPSKMQKKNFYIILDNLSYRMMGIGFPLFTLGILSGAVWANEAWGSYWSWDIKEVGSFINWLLVALYFHCRYKNFISLSHIVAFISLMVLFFNFFGISLGIFGSSLHAYGASS